MLASVSELVSWLAGRFRSRAELELEVIALRHQLAVLHRHRPGRHQRFALDRLFWNWLYRVWPRCLNIIVLVKPATVVQWHRQGLRLYWRRCSRSGRPSVDREVRDLIRQVNSANPLLDAPRIHGESLEARNRRQPSHGRKVRGATGRKAFAESGAPFFAMKQSASPHRYIRHCVSLVSTDYVMIILTGVSVGHSS
jgi:hypothetical protein